MVDAAVDLPLDPFELPAVPAAAQGTAAQPPAVAAVEADLPTMPPPAPPGIPPTLPMPVGAEVGGSPAPAQSSAARPAVTTAAAASAVGASGPTTEALWRAFCEGVGVRIDLPQGLDEATMRTLGQTLHAAIAGALQLIAVRASTKQELRADVTIIRPQANNPLKFTPDAATAIDQLLRPPMRGFMAGPQAMDDAMNDLVGHSIGTMAGMRAALEGVLDRFAPDQLEAKLSGSSLLDSLLPMNRKARLWDLYLQHFGSIRDEAQDDFHTLFGKAFLAAYEQQQDRLRKSRP